ncbi:hypothetical protein AB0L40_21740 [Patulibacter sp. NPDC049589]|uniref:hypothetical protein n=1 Tax=Patulibacter sp. NPDC049589 TaxID=3154731 RepID=UPI00343C376C
MTISTTADAFDVRPLDLRVDELEPLEAPDFWDGVKAGLAVGATAGAAVVGYAAATGGAIAFT